MKRFRSIAGLAVAGLVLAACSATGGSPSPSTAGSTAPTATPDPKAGWPDQLVIGFVPSREADALVEKIQPVADYLSQTLGIPTKGYVSNDYTGLVEAIGSGQADVGAFGPFALIQARDRSGADIILQSVRHGSATYHTQWMTNNPDKYCADTPVADANGFLRCNGADAKTGPVGADAIAKVAGAKVSFVEQSSASGYIFPALQLLNAGIDYKTGITPIFSGGHDKSVIAVCNGDAEVGVSFDDARTIAQTECDMKSKVVVFALSPEIPNDGWAVAGSLPQTLKDAITQALLDYAKTDAGKAVLKDIYSIDDLVPAVQGAFDIVADAASKITE